MKVKELIKILQKYDDEKEVRFETLIPEDLEYHCIPTISKQIYVNDISEGKNSIDINLG